MIKTRMTAKEFREMSEEDRQRLFEELEHSPEEEPLDEALKQFIAATNEEV